MPLRWRAVSTIKLRPFSYSQPALLLSPNTGECTPRLLSLILGSPVPCFLWLFRVRVFPNSCMSQLPKTSQPVKVYVGERRDRVLDGLVGKGCRHRKCLDCSHPPPIKKSKLP